MNNTYNTWFDIKGFEGLYQINQNGEIRSLYNYRKYSILKPKVKKGYYQIGLRKKGIRFWYAVHRLVAETFIPNPDNLPCVNHKDENKLNNHVDNLEWCTHSYNNIYGTRIDKVKNKTRKSVLQYNKQGVLLNEFASIADASKQTQISIGNISACCRKYKNYSHAGGYIWKYKSEVMSNANGS